MSKKILLSFLLGLSILGSSNAQVGMNVPFGSFEQWTTHPGYSVTVLSMSLPMYDSFSTPTGWGHLAYPVNETISMGFANVTVNTDVPLIVATQETGAVPDSSSAVKLQSFMISDILNPAIMALASSYLDTSLINTVIPSILSTGEVNVEHLLPIITDIMSSGDSLLPDTLDPMSLLDSILDIDINYYFTGGIPVADFQPSHLTGSYKYHSAVSGDNGGVVMIGTRYNATLGKRQVVGGGVNISLTDCDDYTPFEVEYMSLNALDASLGNQEPDSLIVILVSSASLDRQQGSYMCVDNLTLWLDTMEVVDPDTCPGITGLSIAVSSDMAEVSWNYTEGVELYELEYGEAGFTQGTGAFFLTGSNSVIITDLSAGTQYDLYIHTVCDADNEGAWILEHFVTDPDTCARIISIVMDSSFVHPVSDQQVVGYEATWQSSFEPERWEVEYGIAGFATGTGVSNVVWSPSYTFGNLDADSQYEFRVRSVCNGGDFRGEWKSIQFHTAAVPPAVGIDNDDFSTDNGQLSVVPNPANGRCVVSLAEEQEAQLSLYSLDGSLLQSFESNGSAISIELPSQGVFLLRVVTPKGSFVRKIVNR